MRVTGSGSVSARVSLLLNVMLAASAVLVALEMLGAIVLVINPQHPARHYFQATTIARVGPELWPSAGLVKVSDGSATATVEPMAFITFQPSSRGFVLVLLAVSLMWWAFCLAIILQLRGVCMNLSSGTPFSRDNIRRLRTMGWSILGTVGVELLIDAIALIYMHARVTVAGGPVTIPGMIYWVDFPLGTAIAGFAVLVLAEIFRAGANLQDDQALTI